MANPRSENAIVHCAGDLLAPIFLSEYEKRHQHETAGWVGGVNKFQNKSSPRLSNTAVLSSWDYKLSLFCFPKKNKLSS